MIWTADGRPHPAVVRTLRFAAQSASMKYGKGYTPNELLQKKKGGKHEFTVAILRRRAARQSYVPRRNARSQMVLRGFAESVLAWSYRADQLDDHDVAGDVLATDLVIVRTAA